MIKGGTTMKTLIKNYIDVTNIWFNNAKPKTYNITHTKEYIDDNGNKYIVNNKRYGTYYDKKSKDYRETMACAKLLRNIFGGKIILQPIVSFKDGISTCDFKWLRPNCNSFEKWDLKTVNGSSNRTLDNMIKNKKRQSNNFIFDIKNHTISKEVAIKQIEHIFNDPQRNWVNIIILKEDKKIILILKKK